MMIKGFNSFLNSFLIYFESHCPMLHTTKKLITLGSYNDLEYYVKKKSLYILTRRSSCPLIAKYYNQYCTILRKVIRNPKYSYYNSLLMTAENKSQTSWSIINNESGKVKNKHHTPLMFRSGKTFFQIDSAAAAFSWFLNVVEKWNVEKVDIHSALLSLSKLASQDFPDMTIIPRTEVEVIYTFTSLKNKNSSGYDSISYRIVKFCGKFCGI